MQHISESTTPILTIVTSQILTTKLYKPSPIATLVARPRLVEQIEAGSRGKLTLVSAPAGYGKSTLISEWIHQCLMPAAWLSLDADDNDPVRFWAHFMAALNSISHVGALQVGEAFLQRYQNSPDPDQGVLFERLVLEIAAIPEPFTLILDDVHLVTSTEILDGLFYLLENLPAGMAGLHLVLSSRSDPPWPLARLRVRGEMVELRARDLRFTLDEAAQFLNDVMQLALGTG